MFGPNSPLFQCSQVYDKPPFLRKSIWLTWFFIIDIRMVLILISDITVWKYSFFAQIFSSETTNVIIICKLCLLTAKRVYKNQITVYEYVNIFFLIKYMKRSFFFEDQVYDWGRFQKTCSHSRTKITPKYPPNYYRMALQVLLFEGFIHVSLFVGLVE